MSSEYSYNAPQFYSNLTDVITVTDDEDDFFDATNEKSKETEVSEKPCEDVGSCLNNDSEDKENYVVISDDEDEILNDSFSKIKIKSKFEGIDLSVECDRKSHPMLTRQDISILSPKLSLELRNRSVLKDALVAERSRLSKKRKAEGSPSQGNSVAKYRSLSEAIYHFQKDTPPRFRTVSKKSGFKFSVESHSHVPVTVPSTPHFLSDQRLRHCSDHCLSQEERELIKVTEAKQNFKPSELNKKIFDPPKEVEHEKKFTVPKPFNLSNPPPKKVEDKKEVFEFKARPLPRKIYSVDNFRVSTNRLPVLMEEDDELELEDIYLDPSVRGFKEASSSKFTKVKPFSFDERDKMRAKRKEEHIMKIIESEKKMAVFKAQPLPSYICADADVSYAHSSTTSTSYHRHELDEFNPEFKARPANVLKKKPFQVKKCGKAPTKFLDIKLQTEMRAQQRSEFEQQKKENEVACETVIAKLAEEEQLKANEELLKLRKDTVHKPLPLPKFLQKSKESSKEDLQNNDCENLENPET